jgi:hypothetical protein
VERLALPLAVVAVAGVSGTAIALLIHPGAPGGVAASKIAASMRGSKAPMEPSRVVPEREVVTSPSQDRATDLPLAAPSPSPTPASRISLAPAPEHGHRKESVKAGDGTTDSDPPAAEEGGSETPVSPAPSNPADEPSAEEPTPGKPPTPAVTLSFDSLESTLGQLGADGAMLDPETLLETVLTDVGAETPP